MAYQPIAAGSSPSADALNLALLPGVLAFRAFLAASQNITSRSAEVVGDALAWDTVDLDRFGAWSASSPTRWTCPLAGWWALAGSIAYNASAGGTLREAVWFVNGSLAPAGRAAPIVSSGISSAAAVTVEARTLPLLLSATDYVQLVPLQNSGGTLGTATGSPRPFMSATFAGPA